MRRTRKKTRKSKGSQNSGWACREVRMKNLKENQKKTMNKMKRMIMWMRKKTKMKRNLKLKGKWTRYLKDIQEKHGTMFAHRWT